MTSRIILVAGNTLRGILDKRALYVWGAAVVLMLLRAAPSLGVDGDEVTRAMFRAQAVSGIFESWSMLSIAAAIFLGSISVAADIASKTMITVLARPVARWEVVLGKWIGLLAFGVLSMALGAALGAAVAAFVGVAIDGRALAVAFAHTAVAVALFGAAATASSAVGSSSLAASVTVLLVFVPALVSMLLTAQSDTPRAIGNAVAAVTPAGFEDHYIRAPHFPPAALDRSAALRRQRAPLEPAHHRNVLAENAAFAAIFLLAGCAGFGRRDVRL